MVADRSDTTMFSHRTRDLLHAMLWMQPMVARDAQEEQPGEAGGCGWARGGGSQLAGTMRPYIRGGYEGGVSPSPNLDEPIRVNPSTQIIQTVSLDLNPLQPLILFLMLRVMSQEARGDPRHHMMMMMLMMVVVVVVTQHCAG